MLKQIKWKLPWPTLGLLTLLMKHQPRRQGRLFFIRAPWSRNRAAELADLSPYSCPFRTQCGLGKPLKILVGNEPPFQAIRFGRQIEHFAKQNALCGMRANGLKW